MVNLAPLWTDAVGHAAGAVAPDTEKEEPAQLDSKVEEEEYVCSLCGGEEHHPILGDLDGPYGDDRDGQEIW